MEEDGGDISDVSWPLSEPIDDLLTLSDVERMQEIEQSLMNNQGTLELNCSTSTQQNVDSSSGSFQIQTPVIDNSSSEEFPANFDEVDNPRDVRAFLEMFHAVPKRNSLAARCIPASNDWPGNYGFNIIFDKEMNDQNFVYSEERNKLYVSRDVPCVFKFVATSPVPSNSIIRVMSIYTQPEHIRFDVTRCVNHALADFEKGIPASDHLIRCENVCASYVRNRKTLRRSALVPYVNPPSGLNHSTYLFKFTCLSSCTCGINRRPLKVIFTLENSGRIIGRRSLEVKICACPTRDMKNDDKKLNVTGCQVQSQPKSVKSDSSHPVSNSSSSKKRKLEDSSGHVADIFQFIEKFVHSSGEEPIPDNDGLYRIVVYDRRIYELLMQAKILYEAAEKLRSFPPMRDFMSKNQKQKKDKKHKE